MTLKQKARPTEVRITSNVYKLNHILFLASGRKRAGTHCTGGWVGPNAGLDGCEKSRLYQDSIPGPCTP